MRRVIVTVLAGFGGLFLVLLAVMYFGIKGLMLSPQPQPLSEQTVLKLRIGGYPMAEHSGGFSLLLNGDGKGASLSTILKAIEKGAEDKNVKGILLLVDGNTIGIAQAQEIRDALVKFKEHNKFVYAFADTFGELSNGTISYYATTAATKIWLQPQGTLGLTGMMAEVPFAREALDNFNIIPQITKREEYKSAIESTTEKDFTPAHKEMMQNILDVLVTQIITGISDSRKLTPDVTRKLLDNGPHLGQEAITNKLVDELGYLDNVKGSIKALLLKEGEPDYVSIVSYLKRSTPEKPTAEQLKNKIGVIYLTGAIHRGHNGSDFSEDGSGGSDRALTKALEEAAKDKDIKAIVLRINSGGGSANASETIWRAVKNVVDAKIPVIVSMGDMAASGGYLIASGASKIVAQPGTLTGSIGVYSGKIVTEGLWNEYGVKWGEVHSGENVTMWSSGQPYSEKGWKKLQSIADEIYLSFRDKVAKGRHLDDTKVHDLAKGRVWTGQEAKDKGLVDALGGMTTAIEVAKIECGLKSTDKIHLVNFPKKKTFGEKIMDLVFEGDVAVFTENSLVRTLVSFASKIQTLSSNLSQTTDRKNLEAQPLILK